MEQPLDCIAYMLLKDGKILAEKRKVTKKVVPGRMCIPGGHIDIGENPEKAFLRELHEETGIVPTRYEYVCTLLHRSEEFRKLNYFVVTSWEGKLQNNEAEELVWIPIDNLEKLDLDVDRIAIKEYIRVCGNI